MATSITQGSETITVHVPLTLRRRGGRKQIVTPPGTTWAAPRPRVDTAMVKALARGFRWRKLLETGVYATAHEIAVAEKINRSYISRLLRLTLLAPDIVEAVLDGRAPTIIAQDIALRSLPDEWEAQRRMVSVGFAIQE
ncbi:hypothetical protein [Mesorhizobium sp. IMUNJ 23232]|uniref:hypothetical protein n=1 Tax=Mesorhizobium sp. IMUNJ 23232 TaxID=3376064 RepID=UPI0037A5CC5A